MKPTPTLLLASGILLGVSLPAFSAAPARKGTPADVFVPTKVWTMHLTIQAKDWEKMQPTRSSFGFGGGFGRPGAPQPKAGDGDRRSRGTFGFDFEYVKGDLVLDGQTFKDVAVRFKGNSTYSTSSRHAKRPFKIDLDRFVEGQEFMGVRKLTLNNHVIDPTGTRESLSYAVYRAAGLPAPRTAYAQLTLTVPGKYDRAFLGLYTLVEAVDKPFLEDRFGSRKGILIKPERVGPLDYLGEQWSAYEPRYYAKGTVSDKGKKRFIDLVRLISRGDDATFRKEIGKHLDVDGFLRFLACTVLLSSMDSIIGMGHNWFLYLDPKTDRFVFIPWDFDHSFGGFPFMGPPENLMDLSIRQPQSGRNRLIERLFADDKTYARYQAHLKQLLGTAFTAARIKKDLAALRAVIDPIQEKEKKAAAARREGNFGFGMGMGGMNRAPDLETFVTKRIASVQAQLDGKSKGTPPRFGFGPQPGGGGFPGGGFAPERMLIRPILTGADKDRDGSLSRDELTAGAKAFFAACDSDSKGELDQKQLIASIERLLPRPPGFGGRPGFGRPGGMAPAGPATPLARALVERAGKDGKVNAERLVAAANKLFAEMDKNKDGKLDEKEMAEALRQFLPAAQPGRPR